VPALYLVGERDPGLVIPGMKEIIDDMSQMVPNLRNTIVLPGCGHWASQEMHEDVNSAMLSFLKAT